METFINSVETTVTNNVVLNDKSNVAINAGKLLAMMEKKRISWEQGAYRTSNLELIS